MTLQEQIRKFHLDSKEAISQLEDILDNLPNNSVERSNVEHRIELLKDSLKSLTAESIVPHGDLIEFICNAAREHCEDGDHLFNLLEDADLEFLVGPASGACDKEDLIGFIRGELFHNLTEFKDSSALTPLITSFGYSPKTLERMP
ncbi:hypothetical protein [Neptuniibacter sp. QD37_11]|uniref:hypothetical protein n=1 Tax=Neptuniibacter sp. QD37_11 TaxID=3398209 RepID=UPI0039F46B24